MANRIPKYRPSLTGDQIVHLITLCRKDSSNESLRIIGVLAEFEHKIRNGAINPSHIVEVKQPLSVDLGFSEAKTPHVLAVAQLYEHWKINPSFLNIDELAAVREYRYVNDLMTPEEELNYEKELFGQSASIQGLTQGG